VQENISYSIISTDSENVIHADQWWSVLCELVSVQRWSDVRRWWSRDADVANADLVPHPQTTAAWSELSSRWHSPIHCLSTCACFIVVFARDKNKLISSNTVLYNLYEFNNSFSNLSWKVCKMCIIGNSWILTLYNIGLFLLKNILL